MQGYCSPPAQLTSHAVLLPFRLHAAPLRFAAGDTASIVAELVQHAFNDRSLAPKAPAPSSQPVRLNVKLIRPLVVTVTEDAPTT